MAPRILLCGDVVGKLTPLFKRVSSVSKTNGPFDALLCVGQFFPDDAKDTPEFMEFIEEKREIPLPTYFIGDYGEAAGDVLSSAKSKLANEGLKMEGFPICKNLYWLKGSGILYLHGLRIAYLGGKYVASLYQNPSRALSNGTYHEDDVDALRAFADEPEIVDMFLTNEWPFGILDGVAKPPEFDSANVGNVVVADLAAELKPRYHIAGSEGVFYSREPYRNENASHVTRFVGLGAVGNDKKQKFLHALSPTPASLLNSVELNVQPPNTTISPYEALKSKDTTTVPSDSNRRVTSHDSEGQYWRFSAPQNKRQKASDGGAAKVCFEFLTKGSCSRGDACNFKHDTASDKPIPKGSCFDFVTKGKCERGSECRYRHSLDDDDYRHRSNESKNQSSAPCWFCLASPDIDGHLVVSIGEQCYCALAKGGLVEGHALILPIEHLPSTVSLSQVAIDELNKYKRALHNMYVSQGKRMVVFERYLQLKTATHAHLQIVPIPVSKLNQAREAFVTAGKDLGFTFNFIPGDTRNKHEALCKYLQGGSNYFYVELPDGNILAHVLEPRENMPMQLGREVCAKLLGIPERSDWKVCKLTKNEEVALIERFKENFRAYDPMIS